jgi:MFS family permease
MMVVFAAFGAAVGALAGSIPTIMREASISNSTMGLGLMVSTLMTVLAMTLGGVIAQRFNHRVVLLVTLPLFALCLAAYLMSQSVAWFYLAIIPMGFAFGSTDLFMNAEATAIEHDLRRPIFTTFHGCVSVALAVCAIVSSFLSTQIGTWATGLLAAALLGLAWIMVHRHVVPRMLPATSTKGSRIANGRPLIILGAAAGIIIAAETAALLWSAKLLTDIAPSLAAIAGLGAAFYGVCNAVLRFPGDRLRSSLGDVPLMMVSLAVAIVGFAVLGLSGNFLLSVAAFAAVGLGTAVLIPCIFALAAALVPDNRAGALGFVSLLTGVPRILAPWGFGWIADTAGMNVAFGLLASGLCIALALVAAFRRMTSESV